MLECIEEKTIENGEALKSLHPNYKENSTVDLEKLTQYMTSIINPNLSQSLQKDAGYFQIIYYIMNTLNKEEYINYSLEKGPIKKEIIFKLINKINHMMDFETDFEKALKELSKRIRGNLTI